MSTDLVLANLNSAQRAAVSSSADTLAILAGPGCGKTHTLTSRTAWLLQQGLQPWNIIVATFTVKSAREMKERIGKLIGNGMESKLILGTFHSISRRYLARYGHLIKISKDFGIADSADSLAIIKRVVKRHRLTIDPKVARSRISSRKAKGEEADGKAPPSKLVDAQEFEICYAEYEAALERSNLLDYDDLLLRCVELLRNHPSCVSNVEAVLIDEFQDTNLVQFDLMRLFAAHRKRITIVGDPDQSIYGFRAAEVKNYKRMLRQYPDTVTIALEENYRSSGAILISALSVIEQDEARIAKSLMPTHSIGVRPVLRKLADAHREAEWIVGEISRCKALTGELLDLDDIAILLRSAALSRLIESALGKAGIAYRMVGGLRFYDRIEVKTILDYLRVINQPNNNDALIRIINTPSRRIGETTVKALLEEADQSKKTLWSLILGAVQGRLSTKTKLTKQTEQGISNFVNIILTARNKFADSKERTTTIQLIEHVLKKTEFEDWLVEHHGDEEKTRWANVQELMTLAADFESLLSQGFEDESLPEVEGIVQADASDPLSRFLANVALASEVKKDDDGESTTPQITISTIHAAKGLEWPVVFIPATYQGSIPHSRAEDENEERRLLYVAMTRAKSLLYMSFPLKSSQGEAATLSPFISHRSLRALVDQRGPTLGASTIEAMAQILGRPVPSSESIKTACLRLDTLEDDKFPLEGESQLEHDSKWNPRDGPQEAMIQRGVKRQYSAEGYEATRDGKQSWTKGYITTMEKASNFTAPLLGSGGFVSAGTHLQALSEQQANTSPPNIAKRRHLEEAAPLKNKSKASAKRSEGQGTLLGFLGKKNKEVASSNIRRAGLGKADGLDPPQARATDARVIHANAGRRYTSDILGTPPILTAHRLSTAGTATRAPIPRVMDQQSPKRKDYIFLSSSPQPGRHSEEREPVERSLNADVGSTGTSTPSLSASTSSSTVTGTGMRAASTMHATTISLAATRNTTTTRTLGIKRSMNGWAGRSTVTSAFVPPRMKKVG